MSVAPYNPVADWQWTSDGRLVNAVNGVEATITRAGIVTAWDEAAQEMLEFPANRCPVLPWGRTHAGGRGYAGTPWEARTNDIVDTAFANVTAGLADNVTAEDLGGITPTYSIETLLGTNVQKVVYVNDSGSTQTPTFSIRTANGTYPVTDDATSQLIVMCDFQYRLSLRSHSAADALLGTTDGSTQAANSVFEAEDVTYETMPANSSYCRNAVQIFEVPNGTTATLYFAYPDLQEGAFPTAHIPTVAAAVTRPVCLITVPSTGLDQDNGTMLTVAHQPTVGGYKFLNRWMDGTDNYVGQYLYDANLTTNFRRAGVSTTDVEPYSVGDAAVLASRWEAGAVGGLRTYVDGVNNTPVNNPAAFAVTLGATMDIGHAGGSFFWNAPIARIVTYATALSDAQVLALNTLIDGAGGSSAGRKMMMGLV